MCRTIRPGSSSWARSAAILVTAQSSYGLAKIADCTDSMIDSSAGRSASAAAEPVQAGVVVGEQQIVLGREVAIEGPQRHPGVGRDLLGRRLLDALGEEPHHRGLPQRLARAFAARRLGRSDHVRKLPHGVLCQN